jgi:hypothetical protein
MPFSAQTFHERARNKLHQAVGNFAFVSSPMDFNNFNVESRRGAKDFLEPKTSTSRKTKKVSLAGAQVKWKCFGTKLQLVNETRDSKTLKATREQI